jgi:hypothetical protein
MGRLGASVVLAAVVAGLVAAPGASPRGAAIVQRTDILLAFDATSSMGPSIAAAQREAESLIGSVDSLAPETHFAVASFRDRFYPGGEYTLETPMTADTNAIVAAVGTVKPVGSTNQAENTSAEAYNRLFHESYSDSKIGWRASSRKIVVVIGDAEPHGAGTDGLPGCGDTTRDWDTLDTAKELDAMRGAKRTLVMVRQTSTATVALACYSSLAARAYAGGAAVDGSGSDIAGPVLALVKHAYAPLTLTPQLVQGVSAATDGVTISLSNPNTFALAISSISMTLPAGVRLQAGSRTGTLRAPLVQGTHVEWRSLPRLAPGRTLSGHLVLAIGRVSVTTLRATLLAATPDAIPITASARATLRFVAHPHTVVVSAGGNRGLTTIGGTVRAVLGHGRSSGFLRLSSSPGRSVTLRSTGTVARPVGAPTGLKLAVAVTRAAGYRGCAAGTVGVIELVDSDRLTRRLRTKDRLTVRLPQMCGGTSAFDDAKPGGRLSIKLAFT